MFRCNFGFFLTRGCPGFRPKHVIPFAHWIKSSIALFLACSIFPARQASFCCSFLCRHLCSTYPIACVVLNQRLVSLSTASCLYRFHVLTFAANSASGVHHWAGHFPDSTKLVSEIIFGKYVDLSDLLSPNLVYLEPEPQILFDGCVVLSACPKKTKRCIADIVQWIKAFMVYPFVLNSHFSHWLAGFGTVQIAHSQHLPTIQFWSVAGL